MDKLKKSIYPIVGEKKVHTNMSYSYQDVLMYFMNCYENKSHNKCPNLEFVPESKINIIGVRQYKPYNVPEVKKFRKFINK
jgi:hypothetical protein